MDQYLHLFNIQSLRAINGLDAYKIIKKDIKQNKNEIYIELMVATCPFLMGFSQVNYLKKKGSANLPILAVTANTNAEIFNFLKIQEGITFWKKNRVEKSFGRSFVDQNNRRNKFQQIMQT